MTTPLISEKQAFLEGSFAKSEFITTMHERYHQLLFAYSHYLKETDIARIEIIDGSVIMVTRQHGFKLLCNPQDQRTVPIEILNFGAYEQEELECIFNLLTSTSVILDIGANCGYYSLHLARHYPLSKVYAFEPIPATFENLQKNLDLNHVSNVTAYNIGLSDKSGTLPVYFYKQGSGNSSLQNLSGGEEVMQVDCEFRTLDSYIEQIPEQIDFIKCDVEGAELLVLEGGLDMISKHKPILLFELLRKWAAKFSYHPNDVLQILEKLDYRCFAVESGQITPIEKIEDHTRQTNFVFLHRDKHADKF
ncbi:MULTISPECIES: FkbM family methyltransferase [unclassified Paenibacillus]|uniref:FkbM family methyltransferase n=1 Tax=unclassified Paenibacillus TaxID=185978 RepID=UPI0030FA62EF